MSLDIKTWIASLPPIEELDADAATPTGIAAERLGVTIESLNRDGMGDTWFSNPENMPPPPGSPRWIQPGNPFWDLLRKAGL